MYDVENLINDLKAELVAKLNAKLTAIAAEKNDGITTPAFSFPSALHFQTWSDKFLTQSPVLFYGIENVTTRPNGYESAQEYELFFEVVMLNNGQDDKGMNRLLRYSRAVREILEDFYKENTLRVPINVATIRPLSFRLNSDTSDEIMIGGVSVKCDFV